MKAALCSLLLISTLSGLSQYDKTYRFHEDVNGDGKQDAIVVNMSAGVSEFSYQIDFLLGEKRKITVSTEHNAAAFICILPIPDEVSNASILRKLSDSIFNTKYSDSLPADVLWLAQVMSNSQFFKTSGPIDYASKFTTPLTTGSSNVNFTGISTIVERSVVQKLKKYRGEAIGNYKRYLLMYYSNNHKDLKCYSDPPQAGLCTTAHGVYINNGSQKASVFINDLHIFGAGSERLRWASIKNVQRDADNMLVRTHATPGDIERVYIVNVKEGKIIRLSNDHFHTNSYPDVHLTNGKLLFQELTLDVTQLFTQYAK